METQSTKIPPVAIEPAVIAEPEAPEPADTQEPDEPTIAFNPNITIQPADPGTAPDEGNDLSDQEALVDYTRDFDVDGGPIEPPVIAPSASEEPKLSLEELLVNARKATAKRKFEEAINFYWQALGRTNQQADVWNSLSKVYLANGQTKNAATTALEATRLDPKNIQYVLDYLRVVQRVKTPTEFIKELEVAYDRFPRSPEITLSLARGYGKVGNNDYAAAMLYRRFIQIAPNHPMRSEADAALERIQ